MARPKVFLTIDVEPDCPPYLWTWRGMDEGMPRLLELVDRHRVAMTFFITGATAMLYPEVVRSIAARGHEIGCHGYSHRAFTGMDESEARSEIVTTNTILRRFAPVVSFRAPYLRFPESYVSFLADDGIKNDASRARYKRKDPAARSDLARLEASIPTSLTRLPGLRNPLFWLLPTPVVLFVHPWEFVDLQSAPIPFDCRFRTGQQALDDLDATILHFKRRNADFLYVRDCAAAATSLR